MSEARKLLERVRNQVADIYHDAQIDEALFNEIEDYLNKPESTPVGYVDKRAITNLNHPGTNYELIYRQQTGECQIPVYIKP